MIATVIISLLLAAALTAIVYNMYTKKKRGGSSCSCGCSGCSMSDICRGGKK